MRASILLEDGTMLEGFGHGTPGECVGEFVFNTAMSGYEEVLTDPSYRGQIVVFTTSHIGNTGITHDDMESGLFQPSAFLCKEFSPAQDNHRSRETLNDFLLRSQKLAVSGVDTRSITRRLRDRGCMMGIVSTLDHNHDSLASKLKHSKRIESNAGLWECAIANASDNAPGTGIGRGRFKVAIIDFGMKKGISESLRQYGCQCQFFGPDFSVCDIEAIQPDGLFLSNGAGDPRTLLSDLDLRARLLDVVGKYPTFGICLGHQILGLLFGAEVEKLPFGHHAINHPVKLVRDAFGNPVKERVFITSQNHNYHVKLGTIENSFFVTHLHGNDGTVAGMRHRELPIFSVQFHPESNPGPRDAEILFQEFANMMEGFHASKN